MNDDFCKDDNFIVIIQPNGETLIKGADSMKKYQVVITNKAGNQNYIRFTGVPSETYPTLEDVEVVVRVFKERFINIQPDEHGCLFTVSIQEV